MIPPFDPSGWLPPGIHPATLAEIDERFGRSSELRRVQMESVRWMVDLALRAGATRIVLNGSFVTDRMEPNDVDCVVLFPSDANTEDDALSELRTLPFLHVALVNENEFDELVHNVFGFDRFNVPKGVVEVAQ